MTGASLRPRVAKLERRTQRMSGEELSDVGLAPATLGFAWTVRPGARQRAGHPERQAVRSHVRAGPQSDRQ